MTSRRDLLRLAVGGGLSLAGLTACGAGGVSTTTSPATTSGDPLAPPSPIRTPTPDAPPRRLIALSSADLDVLQALDREPTAAWAVDGTGPRPWRMRPAPPSPEWDGPGLPSLRSLLPFGVDAFVLATADVTESELRGYERLATVIVDPQGRPGWRDHLDLVAGAVDRDPAPAAASTGRALEEWAGGQRRIGVDTLVVVIGTGARPDTPVATLAAESPLGTEIRALGFDVDSRPEPVPYRDLRRTGVQVVRVDPRDGDLVAAVRQPSVTSLPWALERLTRGRRSA
ncbi:ABC transporter substrate-binding protein [Dietzia sp. B32]|uniref:ABC transporter substrate-binding protein n=1 Tax=Dietzia sp. B32 TaxID=2915130 RepID=UPI0021ADF86A|nr:ABC transporter substrate-binding protein [Dietzia sp. B32]UVE95682.1 ABC transporter substrate-binding protein [Dietzia sp. B32]